MVKRIGKIKIPFQSTPPARGATSPPPAICATRLYFNPRPPRGGRRIYGRSAYQFGHFNPRPPRGGRLLEQVINAIDVLFQSTPPARGATLPGRWIRSGTISFQSTPPARGATDNGYSVEVDAEQDFNPRPPRGGRPRFLAPLPPGL